MSEGERRLAAIMFTDMVGHTAVAQKNESLAMSLLEEHRRILRPLFAKNNGREVKTTGDGFLVEFASALEAVRCAIEIQSAVRDANRKAADERRILVRIGIHLGDVIHEGADVAGDAVNVASRIEPLAPPGGICVSAQVQASVVNKVEQSFRTLGVPELKNVATPIEVFCVSGFGEQVGKAVPQRATQPTGRIAVLPFANMSPDPQDEYFSDGMTEEVISTLSKVRDFEVISRTSVMQYRKTPKPIKEVSRELDAGTILEGSVRKAGNRLRITVQMIDAVRDRHLWAESYDRDFQDIFAIQGDIAGRVAEGLKVQLLSEDRKRLETKPTDNPQAYTLYLKGRFYWNERTEEGVRRAVRYFEQALAADQNFAKAYTGLADCYLILADYGWMMPAKAGELAKESALKALAIEGSLAEAHASLGLTYVNHVWDFEKGESEYKRAIELNPNYASVYHWYSVLLSFLRRYEDSLRMIERAVELDPFSPIIRQCLGVSLMSLERYGEAMDQFQKVEEENPDLPSVHYWMSLVHLAQSRFAEALEEAEKEVASNVHDDGSKLDLAFVRSEAGRKEEAVKVLDEVLAKEDAYYSPCSVGVAMLSLGREKEALDWMERACAEHDSSLLYFRSVPAFRRHLAFPGWVEIERKMGFTAQQ